MSPRGRGRGRGAPLSPGVSVGGAGGGGDDVLEDDGLFVVQLSYTPLMLQQMAWDNICHEHKYYYSLFNTAVQRLLPLIYLYYNLF